ncbi:MAG: transposase [Gammaproteobacteria bacterium]|nr:transposase [Gammaproteobacteria bacterium]
MTVSQVYKRYSEAFKRQVVAEYEAGASANALCRKYGIGNVNTVQAWVKQYAREGLRHETVHIQTAAEADGVRQLERERDLLRQALAEVTVQKLLVEGMLRVYQEAYGDTVLKKNGPASSAMLTKLAEEP